MHENSESWKCGRPPSNLKEQCAPANDQYPKTLRKANDALVNHKWDDAQNAHPKEIKRQWKESNQRNNNNSNSNNNSGSDGEEKTQLTQKDKKTCHCCGKTGNTAPDSLEWETKPKNEWHMFEAVSACQTSDKGEDETNQTKETSDERK